MVAPYTAADLIRVMEHEMNHHHQEAARRRSWLRRDGAPHDGGGSAVRADTGRKRVRRPGGMSFLSLFSKPTA